MIFVLLTLLVVSVLLNMLLIFRFVRYNGEFWLNDEDPDDVKPILKFDLDECLKLNYIVIRILKKDKERK